MVACKPVDFRKGMNSLAALVTQALAADSFAGDVFIFRSRRSDRLKLLIWDGTGLCLVTKRLESGGFTWPPVRDGAVTLNQTQPETEEFLRTAYQDIPLVAPAIREFWMPERVREANGQR